MYGYLNKPFVGCWRQPHYMVQKFGQELEQEGFTFCPYDPCVANRERNGSQHTLLFHLHDLESSQKDLKVNDQFKKWLQWSTWESGKLSWYDGKSPRVPRQGN